MERRDELVRAMRERVQRVVATGDASEILTSAARAEAHHLVRYADAEPPDLEAAHVLGRLHYRRARALPGALGGQDRSTAIRLFTKCFIAGRTDLPQSLLGDLAEAALPAAQELTNDLVTNAQPARVTAAVELWRRILRSLPDHHPERADCLTKLRYTLLTRFQGTQNPEDLEEAVQAMRAALDTTLHDDPRRPRRLYVLSMALEEGYEQSGDAAALEEAAAAARAAALTTQHDDPQYAEHLCGLGRVLRKRYQRFEESTDLDEAVRASRSAVEATPHGHPELGGHLDALSTALVLRFERIRARGDLDEAVETSRAAVEAAPDGDFNRGVFLANLKSALVERFENFGQLEDLHEAERVIRAAARATPDDHPSRVTVLAHLGHVLARYFDRFGEAGDLDEAVEAIRAAESASHGLPQRAERLNTLALVLTVRYDRFGEVRDLDEAVAAIRSAIRATPRDHPDYAWRLKGLGQILEKRYACVGRLDDLEEAVEASRAAARATTHDHPDYAWRLHTLGLAVVTRFGRFGEVEDLAEALAAIRTALRATPGDDPAHAGRLELLSSALVMRFRRFGKVEDLDEAVEASRTAVHATAHDHPNYASRLINLSHALGERYRHTGRLGDLDNAVEACRTAVEAAPNDDLSHAQHLDSLSMVLVMRFRRFGEVEDLDGAVTSSSAAVRATPPEHPKYTAFLGNLGTAQALRFERFGEVDALNNAVAAHRADSQATPQDHPNHAASLENLSRILETRFRRTGNEEDAEEAVEAIRSAVRATPLERPDRAGRMDMLSIVLMARFEQFGDLEMLDEAVEASRTAVRSTPLDHPRHASFLGNLGVALAMRYERSGESRDLDEAVSAIRTAVRATPPEDLGSVKRLVNLAITLHMRFERHGAHADWTELLSVLNRAICRETDSPTPRVEAARWAAALVAPSHPGLAAGFLEQAVLLLPELAPRRLRRDAQQEALGSNAAGLAADATALALAAPDGSAHVRATRALKLAEAGRAVLLSQALDTRSDLTDLRAQHPDFARRFTELRALLDEDPGNMAVAPDARPADGHRHNRHQLEAELVRLMGRIRAREGFEDFGLPPSSEELVKQAAHGPVVTFNISRYGSDALLLTRQGISAVPLPGLGQGTVRAKVDVFYRALAETTAPDSDRIAAQRALRGILEWLWETAAEPALAALQDMGEVVPPTWPGQPLSRVWWAPGGLLGLLPLHAAGFHTDPTPGPRRRTVLDRVVSSYTPTVRALRHARERRSRPAGPSQSSLIVAMPTTPGHSPLRHAAEEARRIRPLLPRTIQLTASGPVPDGAHHVPRPDTPTTAGVLDRLSHCAIAHFACHGATDHTDPSRSRLLLHDYATTPLTVSTLAQINLDHAQLAYLSACSTAAPTNSVLLDEAIHLTSAFQLAGFPHVIGTLWPIDDRLAVEVAESFYTHLTTGPARTLAPDHAATALHHTIRTVRDRYPATPSLWAAYLHAGA